MIHMPGLLDRIDLEERTIECNRHCVVSIEDGVQTMQLMCHRRREYGIVFIMVDRLGEIVVPCGILYFDVT